MRLPSSDRVVIGAAALVVAAGIALARPGDARTFIAFTLLIAVSELFEVALPNDVRYSLGLAPAVGLALLGTSAPDSHTPIAVVLAAFALGIACATAVRTVMRRDPMIPVRAGHVLTLGAVVAVYGVVERLDTLPRFGTVGHGTSISVVGLAAMLVTFVVLETAFAALRRASGERMSIVPVYRDLLASTAGVQLSIISVGALLAISYPALDLYAFPLFLAPLGATQYAFKQFSSIRRTYLQTIRALSKVPEMAGYTQPGHSTRVAELAVAMARELAAPDEAVAEIQYAALLHDIGRVSIPDPSEVSAASTHELAIVGAGIVRETGHFPAVAEMIERQHDPYRRRGEDTSPNLPLGAKIIKIASAYDDFTRAGSLGLSPRDALDRLYAGMAYDFDPEVIKALTRVLEKSGRI